MANLASVDDLQKLMGRTFAAGEELDQAEMVLTIVSAWARSVAGQEWPAAPVGVPADVVGVVLTASRRVINNPSGVISEVMGPFSVTYDKPPIDFFTAAELAILKRFRPKRPGGLFTVSTTRGEVANATPGFMNIDDNVADPMPVFFFNDPNWEEAIHFDN